MMKTVQSKTQCSFSVHTSLLHNQCCDIITTLTCCLFSALHSVRCPVCHLSCVRSFYCGPEAAAGWVVSWVVWGGGWLRDPFVEEEVGLWALDFAFSHRLNTGVTDMEPWSSRWLYVSCGNEEIWSRYSYIHYIYSLEMWQIEVSSAPSGSVGIFSVAWLDSGKNYDWPQ